MSQSTWRAVSLFWIATAVALGQTTTGSIVGTVTDPSDAVVASAAVTVTNVDTGSTFRTTTDTGGSYVVTPVQVGQYSVSASAPGFKEAVRSGIRVDVQARVRIDFTLQVGQISESVEVVGAEPLLQTDSSYLGQVVESKRIGELPLNGRYVTRLAVLSTGAVPTPFGAPDARTGGFSANGVRPYENNYILDGVDNSNLQSGLTSGATYVIGPAPDAIAEFKVQTNSMSAEFGHSAGGVMNVTIKSGTNQLHGSLYEFMRNSSLDAKNYFDSGEQAIPPFKLNQFGFSVGGPVDIPGVYHGENKTFFFGDYQGTRIRRGLTLLATVPPSAWKDGDFSGFDPIFDPATTSVVNGVATRQRFPDNRIPLTAFDPAAKGLIDQFPEANLTGDIGSSGVSNNYLTSPSQKDDTDQYDIRVDHRFSDSDSLFVRFSLQDNDLLIPAEIPPPLGGTGYTTGNTSTRARSAALSNTHIFTPRTVNEFRLGYTRNASQLLQFGAGQNQVGELGIPGIPFSEGNGGLPAFSVNGLSGFGSPQYEPTIEIQDVYQIIDNLSLVRGPHTIKIGAEIKPRVNFSFLQPTSPRGSFSFSGDFTRDPNDIANSGLGTADFLLGAVGGAGLSSFVTDVFQQPGYAFFVQDDVKVTRKLTLNLGLRYDFISNAKEKYNAAANFNLETLTLDIVKGRQDPLPANFSDQIPVNRNASRTLVPNDRTNFAPRLGFAYNLQDKTVVRGGYGIFYSTWEAGPLSNPNMGLNPPFYYNASFPADSLIEPNPIVSQLSNGFPADALSNPDTPSFFSLDQQFRNPYVQNWNLSVQRELWANMVFEIAYAGSKGTALYEFRNANQALPTADPTISRNARRPLPYLGSGLSLWCSCGSSSYNSLQAKVEKRFSNDLSFLAAYTYGKAIDERSQASFGIGSRDGFRDATRHPEWERGLADYDIRHRFVLSYTYDLPFGRDKRFGSQMSGVANAVLGGWEILGIDAFQTGFPQTIRAGSGVSNSDGQNRPDAVPGVSAIPANQGPSQWFNPAAFQTAVPGTFGNVGRNTLEGPGQINIDLSIFKNFQIGERYRLQFRSEFFNLPNHPNFQGNSMSSNFDRPGAGRLTAANPSRQIQFALRFTY